MATFKRLCPIALGLALTVSAWGQSSAPDSKLEQKREPGAAREIGAGAGAIGTGAAKGAGSVAKGTAKGAADLFTLHPIAAGNSIGKGAATAGRDVTASTIKGTGKITRGVGRAFRHLF